MWRYPEPSKVKNFFNFSEKSKISQDLAVVLCGAIPNRQKLRFFQFFNFWENSEKSKISQDLAVALCGAIPNRQKLRFFQHVRFLGKSRKVKNFSRLAVALRGAILNRQKLRIFRFWRKSRNVKNFSRFGCGAMWRYPDPSKVRNFSIFSIFGKIPKSQECQAAFKTTAKGQRLQAGWESNGSHVPLEMVMKN